MGMCFPAGPEDIFFVRRAMMNVSAKWTMIAVRFGLAENRREAIKREFKRDSDQCLTAVIKEWLMSPGEHSWKDVICAIAGRVGGDSPLEAGKVAEEYQSKLCTT